MTDDAHNPFVLELSDGTRIDCLNGPTFLKIRDAFYGPSEKFPGVDIDAIHYKLGLVKSQRRQS